MSIKDLFDFEHIDNKTILLNKINAFLNETETRDLEFIYKMITGLETYKQAKKG